ncbi:MAG: hypothetical protein ACI9IT_000034 [Glaciecola sp.]|jgi:hypothetical protein
MQKKIKHVLASSLTGFLLLTSDVLFDVAAQSVSFSEIASADMINQLHSDEFTLINVGDHRVPIIISTSEQPISKGIMLIIGDADMPLGRQDSLTHIANYLPALGWTTVVMPSLGLSFGSNIALPIENEEQPVATDKDPRSEPEASDNNVDISANNTPADLEAAAVTSLAQVSTNSISKKVTETINSSAIISSISEAELIIYSQEVEAYIAATLTHMQTNMGHRILVSQGITAATIAKLVADGNPLMQQIDTLVINNPYWPIRKLNNKLPMVIAQIPIPVLDLTSHWDNSWSKQTQRARRIKATTELKEIYRQTEIIGQSFDQTQMKYISRQIKGWISYLGW